MAKSEGIESTAGMTENAKDVAFDVLQFGGGAAGGYILTDTLQKVNNSFVSNYAKYVVIGASLAAAILFKNKVVREIGTGVAVGSITNTIVDKVSNAWTAKGTTSAKSSSAAPSADYGGL